MPEDNKNQQEQRQTQGDINELLRDSVLFQREANEELGKAVDYATTLADKYKISTSEGQKILSISKGLANLSSKILSTEEDILKSKKTGKDIAKEITAVEAHEQALLGEIQSIESKLLIAKKDKSKEGKAAAAGLSNLLEKMKKEGEFAAYTKKQLEQNKISRDKILQNLGATEKLVKGIHKIPVFGQFLNAKDALEDMSKAALNTKHETGSIAAKSEVMLAGFKAIGKQIKEGMLDPLFIIAQLTSAGLKFDESVTFFAKDMGISNKAAKSLRMEMTAIANDSGRVAINSADIQKSLGNLQAQFGTVGNVIRKDIVEEMSILGKLTDMSAESQGKFALYANISGKNAAVVTDEARAAVIHAESEKGLRLDINKVLDEAGKITGQIAAQLGGNVVKISQAIAVAKQFGMTLEQVAKSGSQLLQFEQSISNELEAELLTGRQLNLEKARLAALTGDYEVLTREINKNIGDFGDFTKMNVLQQKALADAVGMTVDGLSDVLLKNENIEQLASEARAAGNEDLAKQLEKRNLQQEFNDALDKMKQLFVDIVGGPVGDFFKIISGIVGTISSIGSALGLGENQLGNWVITAGLLYVTFSKVWTTMKGMKAAMQSNIIYQKIKNALGKKELATETSTGTATKSRHLAERLGLITKRQAVILRTRDNMLQKEGVITTQARNFYEGQSLGLMIKRNVQRVLGNLREKIGLGLGKAKLVVEKLINSQLVIQGIAMLRNVGRSAAGLGMTAAKAVANIAKSAWQALGGLPVVGPILAAAAIAGGVAALYGAISKAKQANDLRSGPTSGAGYGSRMLLAPEGAFALNNKDTVIAGTNLFKGNDIISAEPDTFQLDDSAKTGTGGDSTAVVNTLKEEINGLRGDMQEQTTTIKNKPVAVNNVIDPNSLVKQEFAFEKQLDATVLS